jgi:hypothetical protein
LIGRSTMRTLCRARTCFPEKQRLDVYSFLFRVDPPAKRPLLNEPCPRDSASTLIRSSDQVYFITTVNETMQAARTQPLAGRLPGTPEAKLAFLLTTAEQAGRGGLPSSPGNSPPSPVNTAKTSSSMQPAI